jgi:hypothetical protein
MTLSVTAVDKRLVSSYHVNYFFIPRPWSPSAPPEAGKLDRGIQETSGCPLTTCGHDDKIKLHVSLLMTLSVTAVDKRLVSSYHVNYFCHLFTS